MNLYFHKFTKPVAFYGYTSMVVNPIIEINMSHHDVNNDDEEEIIHFIEDLRSKCDKLKRIKYNNGLIPYFKDDTALCTTRKDNKTVIAMSDGKNILYFGLYDSYYMIGFGVKTQHDDRYTIDLSDLKQLPNLDK